MKRNPNFIKKAAYFSLGAPFLVSFVESATKGSEGLTSDLIVLSVNILLLLSGLCLGVYALWNRKVVKGVFWPATIGIILHLLIGVVACKAFIDYRNQYRYYKIVSNVANSEIIYKQVLFGRISPATPMDKFFSSVISGITSTCKECEVESTEAFWEIPEEYRGIFSQQAFEFSYIAVDTNERTIGDLRFIFPEFDPQPDCQQLASFIDVQKRAFNGKGNVSCVDSLKH